MSYNSKAVGKTAVRKSIPKRFKNQIVTDKICLRKFCLDFEEFKGFALKNPTRGVAP